MVKVNDPRTQVFGASVVTMSFFLTALFAICNRNFILRHEDLRVRV